MLRPLADDPRLAAPVTFAERYLPLPDFARRLSRATKEAIEVDSRMSARKLTLFVDGKPAAETMAHVADALGAVWRSGKAGWTLAPDPDLARDEAAAERADEARARRAVGEWLRQETLKARGKGNERGRMVGEIVLKIGLDRATETLLAGRPILATGDGRDGTVQATMEGYYQGTRLYTSAGVVTPTNGMIALRRDPATGDLRQSAFTLGVGAARVSAYGPTDVRASVPPEKTDLDRRLENWTRAGDAAATEIALKTLAPERDPYGVGLASLADVLARLHDRTGRPFVAESFRMPIAPWGDPAGSTLAQALRSVAQSQRYAFSDPTRILWRSQGAWATARFRDAWKLRRGEIPEDRLAPMERERSPSLGEYASLAGSLSPRQRAALEAWRPLARFSTTPLRQGFWGLYVYDAVPEELRERAIAYGDLPEPARSRWNEAVGERLYEGGASERWIDALLQNRPPAGAGFAVSEESRPRGTSGGGQTDLTWVFHFGADADLGPIRAPLAVTPIDP